MENFTAENTEKLKTRDEISGYLSGSALYQSFKSGLLAFNTLIICVFIIKMFSFISDNYSNVHHADSDNGPESNIFTLFVKKITEID